MEYSHNAQFIETSENNEKQCSNRGYLCMFKTPDVGESRCSLNVSETGKRLEASFESPGVSHLCKLTLILHLQVPQRDTEKRRSDPLGPRPHPVSEIQRPQGC